MYDRDALKEAVRKIMRDLWYGDSLSDKIQTILDCCHDDAYPISAVEIIGMIEKNCYTKDVLVDKAREIMQKNNKAVGDEY